MKCQDDYTTFINEIIAKRYAEDVSKEEAPYNNGHVWYIPLSRGVLPQEAWQNSCRVRLQCKV